MLRTAPQRPGKRLKTSKKSLRKIQTIPIHSPKASFSTSQNAPPRGGDNNNPSNTQPTSQTQYRPTQQPTQPQHKPQPTKEPQKATASPPTPSGDGGNLFRSKNTARVYEDVAVNTSVTREHLANIAQLLKVNSPVSPQGRMIYNTSQGGHPALAFMLYPNPLLNPKQYETALHEGKIYPRYSYNNDPGGALEHIRGVHYLPQYGKQHLLSQGRIETFYPLLLNHQLQWVIQAAMPSRVEKKEKHRDRIEFDKKGNLIGLLPPKKSNIYYTAVEHNQIQTKEGKLCVDYQIQHLFYDDDNEIIVSPKEQKDRQKLELIYNGLQEAKAQDLLEELKELTIKTNIEVLPDKTQSARARQIQLQEDMIRKEQLENDIQELTAPPSDQERYWDFTHNALRITKSDVFSFLTLTSNNNKLCFNDRFASYSGNFDGTLVPLEYLATLALHKMSEFHSEFVPPEPQIWKDIRHEALIIEQEHLREEVMNEKTIKWKAYKKFREQRKKVKQDLKYEEVYRQLQLDDDELNERNEKRRQGETTGIIKGILDTRRAFLQRERYKGMPLPEEMEVSSDDEGRDREFDVYTHQTEITLNQDEIDYIKEKTLPPPWSSTFHTMRRFEFRSLTPAVIHAPRRGNLFGAEPNLNSQFIELNFFARLVEDQFDYQSYNPLLTGALEEFELSLQQVRAGLKKDHELDLGKMISFSDICRDKPLEIEVWFEIPSERNEFKARADRLRTADPRLRPTDGTRVFTGIITYDAPSSYHFMGLGEDQMKKLFALRQGITITKM
jgi:hypothetical protein